MGPRKNSNYVMVTHTTGHQPQSPLATKKQLSHQHERRVPHCHDTTFNGADFGHLWNHGPAQSRVGHRPADTSAPVSTANGPRYGQQHMVTSGSHDDRTGGGPVEPSVSTGNSAAHCNECEDASKPVSGDWARRPGSAYTALWACGIVRVPHLNKVIRFSRRSFQRVRADRQEIS